MTLRAKLLGLFLGLSVLPLLVLGLVEYRRALRALEVVIAAQNGRVAGQVAEAISANVGRIRSDLALLAENAETRRWFGDARASRGPGAPDSGTVRFLRAAWDQMAPSYAGNASRRPR